MARFANGWVAVTRRIFLDDEQRNEFYGRGHVVLVWATLIAWANSVEGKTRVGSSERRIARGELITSYDQLSAQHGRHFLTLKMVRNAIAYLEKTGRLGRVGGRDVLHVRLLNYEEYQSALKDEGRGQGRPRAGGWAGGATSDGHPEGQGGDDDNESEMQRLSDGENLTGQASGQARGRRGAGEGQLNGQENKVTNISVPLPRTRGKRTAKGARPSATSEATAIVSVAIGVCRRQLDRPPSPAFTRELAESEARTALGEDKWRVLSRRFPTWDHFARAFLKQAPKGYEHVFERETVVKLRALIQDERKTGATLD